MSIPSLSSLRDSPGSPGTKFFLAKIFAGKNRAWLIVVVFICIRALADSRLTTSGLREADWCRVRAKYGVLADLKSVGGTGRHQRPSGAGRQFPAACGRVDASERTATD